MYRYQDVSLLMDKRLDVSMRAIYGVGFSKASYVCEFLGYGKSFSMNQINRYNYTAINGFLKKYYVLEARLKLLKRESIKDLRKLKLYRGIRHMLKLPVRGQRTHSNAKSSRKR